MHYTEAKIFLLNGGNDRWMIHQFFISVFKSHDLNALCKIPKTDLHNHFGLGGDRAYIKEKTKFDITPFWGKEEFYSIDLYGDELAQPIENFIPIYNKAKECGLRLKAHVGEWGTAEDVIKTVQLLSKEYLTLYQCNVLSAEELNEIRINGLRKL